MRLNATVEEVMKKDVKTVNLEDSVEKAAEIMRDNKIGSVLVMGDKNVKGILTGMDIVYKYVAEKRGGKCKDIMSEELVTISPNKNIEDAARLMTAKNIEKLPVLKFGKIVGIITNNDILRVEPALFEILLEKLKMGATVKEDISQFGQCQECGNYTDNISSGLCEECR